MVLVVLTYETAFEKISSGATALQLYTGMIYNGPSIARDIKKQLIYILQKKGFKNIKEAIGSSVNDLFKKFTFLFLHIIPYIMD